MKEKEREKEGEKESGRYIVINRYTIGSDQKRCPKVSKSVQSCLSKFCIIFLDTFWTLFGHFSKKKIGHCLDTVWTLFGHFVDTF